VTATIYLPPCRFACPGVARTSPPFSPLVTQFIEDLGRSLRRNPEGRRFPELVALGFWARAANIKRLKAQFDAAYPDAVRMPRGFAFHVAPSNVDTIFVYSLLLSMLAGNANLVRISSRAGEQSDHLLSILDRAITDAPPEIQAAIAIVQYEHDQEVTDFLSERADLRVIWGGDATVNQIRRSAMSPSGVELAFPNRYSLAVLDAARWLAADDQAAIARAFVNDALWFGQMACSSPRAVVWRGSADTAEAASATFRAAVDQAAAQSAVGWDDAGAVAKLLAEQDMAIMRHGKILPTRTNRLRMVRMSDLTSLGEPASTGGGFFSEFRIDSLSELAAVCRRNWQTVVSHGIETAEWQTFLTEEMPAGIDRIVPVGSALDFNALWDGVDMLATMTRIVVVPPASKIGR
jgi:hypothetical protein